MTLTKPLVLSLFPCRATCSDCENSEQVVVVSFDDLLMCRELTGHSSWLRSVTHTLTNYRGCRVALSVLAIVESVIEFIVVNCEKCL